MSTPASASSSASRRAAFETVVVLAGLLERLERHPSHVDAEQYRVVVQRLGRALDADELPAEALDAVLSAHPAAAELYENRRYAQAGLCRSPLEAAVTAETLARDTLKRAARFKPSSPAASPEA